MTQEADLLTDLNSIKAEIKKISDTFVFSCRDITDRAIIIRKVVIDRSSKPTISYTIEIQ